MKKDFKGKILKTLVLVIALSGCKPSQTEEGADSVSFKGAKEAEALSSSSVEIRWDRIDSENISGYQVFEMLESTELVAKDLVGYNESSYVQTGLNSLKKYRFVVRAIYSDGSKDQNNFFVEATTLSPGDLSVEPSSLVTTTYKTHIFRVRDGKSPYVYSLVSGGGVINSSTGEFVAPATPGVSVIKVTDKGGSFAYVNVKTFTTLKLEPANSQLMYGRSLRYSISGGEGPYSLELVSGSSSAVLNTGTQELSAGSISGNVVVRVTDSNGLQETSLITVVDTYTPEYFLSGHNEAMCLGERGRQSLKCWGSVVDWVMGGHFNIGDEPNEMGDNLQRLEIGNQYEFTKVSLGRNYTCALDTSGNLKCIGYSSDAGNLGGAGNGSHRNDLSKAYSLTPIVNFGAGRTVKDFGVGNNFGCAILDNDRVKCWGDGYRGRTGMGSTADTGQSASQMGDNLPYVDLGTGRTVKEIALAATATCAILDNDRVKCWGDGSYGALGSGNTSILGDDPSHMGDALPYVDLGTGRTAKAIRGGYRNFCAILDNDRLKCWGQDHAGNLGQEAEADIGDDPGEMGDALPYIDLGTGRTVKDAAIAERTACAILDNDKLKCWGEGHYTGLGLSGYFGNQAGEMGDSLSYIDLGTGYTAKRIYTGIGSNHICVHLNTDEMKCWGSNSYGQIGQGDNQHFGDSASETVDKLDPIDLGSGGSVSSIAVGYHQTCAVLTDKSIKCFGHNKSGNLSISRAVMGDEAGEMGNSVLELDVGKGIKESFNLASGGMVLTVDDTIRAWGAASEGRLGHNKGDVGNTVGEMGNALTDIDFGTDRTVKMMAAASASKCAILDNGLVKCFGDGNHGLTGQGSTADLGTDPSQMGDALPYVDLGTGRTAVKLIGGTAHYCALLDNGLVKCWGNSTLGRTGYGHEATIGDDPGEMGDNLPYVDLGTGRTVRDIFGDYQSTCALMDNYELKCWGRNDYGQLGLNHASHIGNSPGEMGDNLPALDFGTSEKIIDVQIAERTTCAHFASEIVKCWGYGSYGALGIGQNIYVIGGTVYSLAANIKAVNFGTNRRARSIKAFKWGFCAVLDNAKIKCWGRNAKGTIGIGNAIDWGLAPSHLGDSWPYVDFGSFN